MSNWVGSAINGAVSLWGVHQQNKNIDKQLSAQAAENQKNRAYNLQLAKLQNSWNLQQWNRENSYNSPSAQIERMRQAGLNPDMMYGGGVSGNLADSSPGMTSGAPSSPMDWSSLANKATIADTTDRILNQELMRAQINKIEKEGEGVGIDNDIKAWEREVVDVMREEGYQGTLAYARASYEEYRAKLTKSQFLSENEKIGILKEQLRHDKVVNEFSESLHPKKREEFDALVRQAVDNADITHFVNQMKALDFWTNKGIKAAEAVIGGIGALKGLKPPKTDHIYTEKGNDYSYTKKWSE